MCSLRLVRNEVEEEGGRNNERRGAQREKGREGERRGAEYEGGALRTEMWLGVRASIRSVGQREKEEDKKKKVYTCYYLQFTYQAQRKSH